MDAGQEFAERLAVNVERFWNFVKMGRHEECWEWTGARDNRGYGRFHVGAAGSSSRLAHRISYGLKTGQSPEAVCHHCDNPPCCNPAHLFGGTRTLNHQDMVSKGRHRVPRIAARGELHHMAKLSNEDAKEIRRLYALGGITQYADVLLYIPTPMGGMLWIRGWK